MTPGAKGDAGEAGVTVQRDVELDGAVGERAVAQQRETVVEKDRRRAEVGHRRAAGIDDRPAADVEDTGLTDGQGEGEGGQDSGNHGASVAPRRSGRIGSFGHVDALPVPLGVNLVRRRAGQREALADQVRLIAVAGLEREVGPAGSGVAIGELHRPRQPQHAREGLR